MQVLGHGRGQKEFAIFSTKFCAIWMSKPQVGKDIRMVGFWSRLLICLMMLGKAATAEAESRILVIGDSMLASNHNSDQGVSDWLESALNQKVTDRSTIGSRYFYALPLTGALGMRISAQFRPADWDWVVMNGGGNDLLFGCGCAKCDRMLDRLVSKDGKSGAIPDFVRAIRASGARVLYLGYLRNPGTSTPIKSCGPAGNELDRRLVKMAKAIKGAEFMPLADLVPNGDTSYHQFDRIHPSIKGSKAIAERVLKRIGNRG